MDYNQALHKLKGIKQEHLLTFFDSLSKNEKETLLNQIDKLDPTLLKKQQALLLQKNNINYNITPCHEAIDSERIKITDQDKQFLKDGRIGCLLVAGGQGTRLDFQGPKGTFLVSPVKRKSLFQIFAEKTIAAGKLAKRLLPLSIMASEENIVETKFFFKKHHNFGLSDDQLSFFTQKSLPLLSEEGNLFLESPFSIAKGADGNGSSLKQFYDSGIFENWKNKGIQFVNYILIDNPLADPFDEKFLFFQSRQNDDVLIKCIKREDPEEHVGVLAKKNGHLTVIEYSEINDNERFKKNNNGELLYSLANISLFSFSMSFIQNVALNDEKMPLHRAFKKVAATNLKGWKFERFIFDALIFAEKISLIKYLREKCFSPLKNKEGKDSLITVQQNMQNEDIRTIKQITKKDDPILMPFEIAQDFYYPTDDIIKKWENQSIPKKHYIEP